LAIGDFSRATHMSIKTLRHYHQIGLLEPTNIDPHTGYRRYSTEQIPAVDAQGVAAAGPAGGIFSNDLFAHGRGQATMFVPCVGPVRSMGRITGLVVPPVELATIVHVGQGRQQVGIECRRWTLWARIRCSL
jgi:hypothetical protein